MKKRADPAREEAAGGLVRPGRVSADHAQWVSAALEELKLLDEADRAGVWLETIEPAQEASAGPAMFRGRVWKMGGEAVPREWARLSAEAPLPMTPLRDGRCAEYDPERQYGGSIAGPMLGLRRVLWVPVTVRRMLRGLILLGAQSAEVRFRRLHPERVAGELALLFELEGERRLAASREADLLVCREVHAALARNLDSAGVLASVTASCMKKKDGAGVGAVFALIGQRTQDQDVISPRSAPAGEERLMIRACSGDAALLPGVERGALETLWRQAIQTQKPAGVEANRSQRARGISRVVALPLRSGEETFGVLIAGLPPAGASLETLQRLEQRSMLASQVLERERLAAKAPLDSNAGGVIQADWDLSERRRFLARIVQAEKLAALGQRASGILHELSNPLTTILGNAQRVVRRVKDERADPELRRILEEAERATGILRQLLDLSRDIRPERRIIDLNELAGHTAELQRMSMAGSPIRFNVDLQKGLPAVEGDFAQLQQVLLNLLQNARQAIEHSGRGTTIGLRTAHAEAGRVKLEVWDDGPGIPLQIQPRVFDSFFTTKPPGLGTGLGLSIVQEFVRQHAGTVSLLNSSHPGATFVVELPAAAKPAPATQQESHPNGTRGAAVAVSQGSTGIQSRHRRAAPRILVVEDEQTVAALIADVLRDEGMHVDVALDGNLALQQVERESYDLLICDLRMPGTDGQTIFHALTQRRNPLREHVLFVTGDVVSPRVRQFLARHRPPHLAKPFRVDELCDAVYRALGGAVAAPAGPPVISAGQVPGNG